MKPDTRLTPAVLESLGFHRQPAAVGRPATFALVRYSRRLEVTADAAAWGSGWDLEGMKPATVADLMTMLCFAGEKVGRRETVHEFLNAVEFAHVAEWVDDARGVAMRAEDEFRAARKSAKAAGKPPPKRKAAARKVRK